MLRGIGKLILCAALTLALGSLATAAAWAACGCNRCEQKSCGCRRQASGSKCGAEKCGCGACGPRAFAADPGSGGYRLDLSRADACCIEPPSETVVRIDGWDLCEKWCDGLVHHPYELTFNGNGDLSDYGPCEAFIPCKRRGVICRTTCGECGTEITCEDVTRPRTIPWWFNPGRGNTYLDESGNPVCGQTLPPKDVPPPVVPPEVTPPAVPPTPPIPPPPPAPPAPPEEPPITIDGRG